MKNRIIAALLCAVLPLGGAALPAAAAGESTETTFNDGTLTYTKLDATTVSVSDCETGASFVTVLPEIDGYEVVSIGAEAFSNCDKLQAVALPENLQGIGEAAFYGCSALRSIRIPGAVKMIDSGAFFNCSAMESAELGEGVEKLGDMVFGGCSALTQMTLPESLTEIGDQTFYECSHLQSVTLPDSLKNLGSYSFYACAALESIEIPAAMESIGELSLVGTPALQEIRVDPANTHYTLVDGVLFNTDRDILYAYPCGRTDSSYTVPADTLIIYAGAFFSSPHLQTITLNEGLEYIGEMAFDFCERLERITIPGSVTKIGETAFADCDVLKEVTFAENPENTGLEIGTAAFLCDEMLKEVELPERVSAIGEHAFGCNTKVNEAGTDYDYIPIEDFTLYGNAVARRYARECDVEINFRTKGFDWLSALILLAAVLGTAAVLGIIWLIIRRRRAAKAAYTQMAEPAQADTPADKTALTAQDVIVPPADPGEPDEPESDYDGAQAYAAYAQRTSGSTQHYIGHAGQE